MRGDDMLNFLRIMGVTSVPWTPVLIGVGLGLIFSAGVKILYLRSTPVGLHVNIGLVWIGVLIGGFLGFCWYFLEGLCRLGLSA